MARKPVLEGGKKDEIISVALKLFLQNGYENTSVRMILKEIGGEIGMFYHYFKSKEEVFEAAIDYYFNQFSKGFEAITCEENGLNEKSFEGNFIGESYPKDNKSPITQFKILIDLLEKSNEDYHIISNHNEIHWTMKLSFQRRTINSLQSYMETIVQNAIHSGIAKNVLGITTSELATFILHGVEGMFYEKTFSEMSPEEIITKKENIIQMIAHILQIPQDMLGKKEEDKLKIPVWLL